MKNIIIVCFLFTCANVFCQSSGMSISPNGSLPDPSAILDISAPNKGVLLPRLTQTQRDSISAPALGLTIFNTTTNCYEGFGFGNWQTISCLCSGPPSTPSTITGNNNPCTNATSVTYSVGLVLGANTYTWTVPADATIIAGQGTNSITVNFGATPGNITVVANNSCGSSSANTLPVTMNSIPGTPGIISGNPYPCANSTAQAYYIAADSGATSYTWSVPSGSIVTAGQGTTSVLVNFSTTPGNLAVTGNNICGASSASVLPISMAITPSTPGSISGNDTFTTNQTGVHYSIAPVTEATTYTWTVPMATSISAGQGTDSITVSFGDNGNICVTAGNCAGTSSPNCLAVTNSCYQTGSHTFTFSGSQQTFTVPCGVTTITIAAYGAQGGSNSGGNGGYGGYANGSLNVNPGDNLYVFVGGQNGYNGGGMGYNTSYNGGGESDVRVGGTAYSNWVIVAGGGGGGSNSGGNGGGGGSGTACVNGAGGGGGTTGSGTNAYGAPGSAGTCTNGGAAGLSGSGWTGGGGGGGLTGGGDGSTGGGYANAASAGTMGIGGNYATNNSCFCCGASGNGGGGGYYGGGGTSAGQCAAGSGGGGSSWASNVMTGTSFSGGIQTGDGKVVISW